MIPAVLDANVLLSGFLSEASPPGQILRSWRDDRFELVTSQAILDEVARAFANQYFRQRLTPDEIQADLDLLRAKSTVVSISVSVRGVATHREDDLVLATAKSGRAGYLVTGDKQLLRLGAYDGIVILSPRAFLVVLEDGSAV